MTKLTAKQESFIDLMTKSDEHARRGFDVLLTKPDFEKLFDALVEAELFHPRYNPAPVPAGEPGYVRVPYWDALNYLEAVAKLSGERNDTQLADKVLAVVIAVTQVSQASEANPSTRDNYHTNGEFAKILGLVPTISLTDNHLDLIPKWLEGKYDRGMVCHALDTGAMRRLLASPSSDDWIKACTILRHCTAVVWIDEKTLGKEQQKPVTIAEDHRLRELINNHAQELGRRMGKATAELLVQRLHETFDIDRRRNLPSWLHRPAIENHPQNHEWLGPENRFVEGLRDVLLSWLDTDPISAKALIKLLLNDTEEILRRISIHLIDKRWDILGEFYDQAVSEQLFTDAHLHELYCLLKNHFESFSESAKRATLQAIQQIATSTIDEEHQQQLKRIQRNWLSAVSGKGFSPADTWFRSLMAENDLGELSEHPQFHSYMEFRRGAGSSQYQAPELLALAELGTIVEAINSVQELDIWKGPTIKALVDSLEEAVLIAPTTFLKLLPKFVDAKRPYQFGVIEGFRRLWTQADQGQKSIDWDTVWEQLIQFFEQLLGAPEFWTERNVEDKNWTPNRDWIPPLIANCIKAGTLSDKEAYSPSLLPRSWSLLQILLNRLEGVQDAPSDATTHAINWPRGKAIEALFTHALRECRVSDQTRNEHSTAWEAMKPIFDTELAKCQNANFEFSALAGNYLPNLEYMAPEWLRANMGKIFPSRFRDNFKCALDGLAYTTVSDSVYALLVTNGVIELALHEQGLERRVRQRLIERIALAYLWNNEQLDSPRLVYLFQSNKAEDLQHASGWFWGIRKEQLPPEHVARILQFWDRCVSWSRQLPSPPTELLSSLGRLSCYLQNLGPKETELLLAVAPYTSVNYNYDFFLEELDRLVDTNPNEVSPVMKTFLDSYVPDYDFEDRLKSIIAKLAHHGKRKDAIQYAEKLRHLTGMLQLYTNLCERR